MRKRGHVRRRCDQLVLRDTTNVDGDRALVVRQIANEVRTKLNDPGVFADVAELDGVADWAAATLPRLRRLVLRRWSGGGLGLVAQEAARVIPALVRTAADGRAAVSYERLAGLLLRGLQEETERSAALAARVRSLEADGRRTQARLAALETALLG